MTTRTSNQQSISIRAALDTIRRVEAQVDFLEQSTHEANSDQTPSLTIVIPVFNERGTVLEVLSRVEQLPLSKQIIIVDDGSTDGTRDLLTELSGRQGIEVVLHDGNQGKGAALQSGFQRARGEVVIVQDADLEYDPWDIPRVIAPILQGQSDVVYGSRYLNLAEQDPSALHRLGNWLLTKFSNWMTQNQLTDMETCYKAIRRSVLCSIPIEQKRFGFEPEITAKLAKGGHRILEVPISYRSRSWSEGKKIGVKDLFNTLWCIVWYRFR